MNLHRVGKQAEWESVAPSKRTRWQRLAAATHSVVTPGNFATLLGVALMVWGFRLIYTHNYAWAFTALLVGRLCDVLDGWLAEVTATKSPLGELLDAIVDKLAVLFTLIVFLTASIAPWWLLAAIILPQIIITVVGSMNYLGRRDQHASRAGKLSMAAIWLSLPALLLARAWPALHGTAIAVGYGAAAASVILGLTALVDYARLARH